MSRNEVVLSGRLTEVDALRHSPAGVPILGFRLAHASRQLEAGAQMQVECEVAAMGVGDVAVALAKMHAGQTVTVQGFLCRRSYRSRELVLHATRVTGAE